VSVPTTGGRTLLSYSAEAEPGFDPGPPAQLRGRSAMYSVPAFGTLRKIFKEQDSLTSNWRDVIEQM
jgi:hypothetical protein